MFGETEAFSSFAVDDLDRAKRFYGETLGVRVRDDGEPGTLQLELGGGGRVLVYEKPDFVPATYTTLNFAVDDVDAAVDALLARGVGLERYDGFDHDEKGIVRGELEIAWFTDPAGNIIAVLRMP